MKTVSLRIQRVPARPAPSNHYAAELSSPCLTGMRAACKLKNVRQPPRLLCIIEKEPLNFGFGNKFGQTGLNLPQSFFPAMNGGNWRAPARFFWILCASVIALTCGSTCKAQTGKRGQGAPLQQPTPLKSSPQNTAPKPPQQKVGIETSPQLFDTMCALWAAGFDTEVNLATLPPAWSRVAEQMAKQQGPATEALRQFYAEHAHNNREETLSRYISYAMVAGPP